MIGHVWNYLRAVYRNRNRIVDQPRFLTYTVTFGCNARCVMCDSWKMPTDGDLTLEEVEHIFTQLPQLDAVRLTGGEPFVRKDMTEIAELAVQHLRPKFIHVTTNGFLTDRIVRFCESRPRKTPLDLLISIDGVGDKHNEIRGNSTAYKSCIETIAALAPRRRELNLSIAVNQTIVDADGVDHYSRLHEELRPYGVQNHIVMAYDVSATYNLEREVDVAPTEIGEFTTFGEFTAADLERLLDRVEADVAEYPFWERLAKRYYLRGIRNRLLGGDGTPNPKCVALNSHLRIFPNGDVPTCQFNSKTVGNLREHSFEEVWNSVKAAEQRKWVHNCAGCWAECEVLPSAIYTGDLLKEFWRPAPSPKATRNGQLVGVRNAPPAEPETPLVELEPEFSEFSQTSL